jgi:hypothetical protein
MADNGSQSPETAEGSAGESTIPAKIKLGSISEIDTSGLSKLQQQQLQMKHAEGIVELNKKAQELHIEVGAMNATLNTMANTVEQVSKSGDAVTITHTQKNALGQTEVVMGNTEAAAKGKISRAQRGEPDRTLWYVAIIAVVIVILVIAITR